MPLNALRGLLPCTDATCTHTVERVDIDDRGSFVLKRACVQHAYPKEEWWRHFGPGQNFKPGMPAVIDKSSFERKALADMGFLVILCTFHVFAAMLECDPPSPAVTHTHTHTHTHTRTRTHTPTLTHLHLHTHTHTRTCARCCGARIVGTSTRS